MLTKIRSSVVRSALGAELCNRDFVKSVDIELKQLGGAAALLAA